MAILYSKNEDTWCKILRNYDAENRRNPRGQPREYSKGGDMDGVLHEATPIVTAMSIISTGTVRGGTGTTTGSRTTGMVMSLRLRSQISSFLPSILSGEFCFACWKLEIRQCIISV